MRLREKVAIVTGAGAGFGRGIALRFASEGAKLVVAEIDEKAGRETAGMIEDQGGRAVFVKTDVSRAGDAERLVEESVRAFGAIHVIVNNAAICRLAPITQLTEEEWDRHLDVNLKGVWLLCKYALPGMMKARAGAIVNIASLSGTKARPLLAAYSASKGGVIMLTQEMALELAPYNIRCNSVSPVFGETPMGESLIAQGVAAYGTTDVEKIRAMVLQGIPLGRAARPEDIANAALFLASEEASLVTGINLIVDGGARA
jgi:NAD(P)-dependent dehydrogenase (short-subunit alcohol dehydrogenase family)